MEEIKKLIRTIPDFPHKGIMFRDITTLLKDGPGLQKTIDHLAERYLDQNLDVVAGVESRGFIIGAPLAYKLGLGFVPIRKPKKLPGETIKEEYTLEYGTDSLEIHTDALDKGQRVLLVDDLIATGGTIKAAAKLIEKCGAQVAEIVFVVELPDLKGRASLNNYPVYSMVSFAGE
jgi:adenine phosphoribosyltransferase